MKKLYVLNLLLFLSIFSVAQFKPITNGKWISERHDVTCLDNNMLDDFCIAKQYMIEGDSILNLKKYYKIYCIEKIRKSYSIPFSYTFSVKYFCGLITNDSLNKKIFYIAKDSLKDTLLYDFNLKLHDTLPSTFTNDTTLGKLVVDSVDSVNLNLKYYKRFFVKSKPNSSHTEGTFFIMEGLGSSVGLLEEFHSAYYFEGGFILKCFSSNEFCYHDNFNFNDFNQQLCDIETNINNKLDLNISFCFYPNPSTTQLTIKVTRLTKESILTISNINGQELIRQKLVDTKTQIDISNLISGVYFVKLITDKTVEVKKIIKE